MTIGVINELIEKINQLNETVKLLEKNNGSVTSGTNQNVDQQITSNETIQDNLEQKIEALSQKIEDQAQKIEVLEENNASLWQRMGKQAAKIEILEANNMTLTQKTEALERNHGVLQQTVNENNTAQETRIAKLEGSRGFSKFKIFKLTGSNLIFCKLFHRWSF